MSAISEVTIRRTRREDVGVIVAMLADDPLGGARERIEDPLPQSYFTAFDRLTRDPNIVLVVAEDGEGAVVGCLQLCILPGLSSQGASRGLIEDVRVAKHCRSRGIGEQMVQWAVAEARAKGCKVVELLTHHTRVDAQRFYERLGFARSHRHDRAILIGMAFSSEACPRTRSGGEIPVRVKNASEQRSANCG
jgi:ribosomal protein S18 acetylase RimI-like enzyme